MKRSALALTFSLLVLAAGHARAQTAPDPTDPANWHVEVSGLHHAVPCPGESIKVVVTGSFPDDCHFFRRIEINYPRCEAPCSPRVMMLVDDGACLGRACTPTPVPFRREVHYWPLPAGDYTQTVSVWFNSCSPDYPDGPPRATLNVPFAVRTEAECATTPPGCMLSTWSDFDPATFCDAHFLDGRARMALRLSTPVALRALEGRLYLNPDSVEIVAIRPIGPAAGMTLVWDPIAGGARFVMFAPTGAPIPATTTGPPPEILEVLVEARAGPPPATAWLSAQSLIGADANGDEIIACPTLDLRVHAGLICGGEPGCDANGDGRVSVRDLVKMLICLYSACPDSLRFDCDENLQFTLDDVICCAHRLLQRPRGTTEPGRPSAATRIALGEPVRTATGWRVPLTMDPIGDVGAARLAIRFPAEAFEIAGVTRLEGSSGWLPLFQAQGGELSLALLELATIETAIVYLDRLVLAIDLRERPGVPPGGDLRIEAGEFSSREGDALTVSLPGRAVTIPLGLRLSPSRPNPFSTGTRFSIGIDRAAADVRVTVHDLSGREIAELFAGPLPAGSRELVWNGENARGERVRDGVYFVRCVSDRQVASQKLVLLKTR